MFRHFDARMRQRRLTPGDEPYIVLRTLSVTYGAQGHVPSHRHTTAQFVYAEAGSLRAQVESTLWLVPPRRGLWVPPEVGHELTALGPVDLRTLYFLPSTSPSWHEVRTVSVCGLLHEAILRACQLGGLDQRNADERRLADLIGAELRTADTRPAVVTMPTDPRARRLADLFLERRSTPETLDGLLVEAGLSRRTAERLFHAETGLSPARWRQQANLADSFARLVAGERIADVAAAAGYSSPSAFSAAFKATMGLAPSDVRA